MSLLESLSDGLKQRGNGTDVLTVLSRGDSHHRKKCNDLQKRGTKHIFVIVLVITRLVSAALGAGGPLDRGGPLHRAGESGRRRDVFHVVGEAEFVEALWRTFALWRCVSRARRLGAVGVAQHRCGGRLVPLDPRVVVADDILVVQAGEQRHLAFDPSELPAGWVDLDALHSVVTTV